MRDAITGCASAVFVPINTDIAAFSKSSILPESPPCPTVLNKPFVAGAWQYLEQLSTLFVPITCLANFCIKYDSSFVALEEEMNDNASGPCFSLIDVKLSAMTFNASSHSTSWNSPFFLTNGLVKR